LRALYFQFISMHIFIIRYESQNLDMHGGYNSILMEYFKAHGLSVSILFPRLGVKN